MSVLPAQPLHVVAPFEKIPAGVECGADGTAGTPPHKDFRKYDRLAKKWQQSHNRHGVDLATPALSVSITPPPRGQPTTASSDVAAVTLVVTQEVYNRHLGGHYVRQGAAVNGAPLWRRDDDGFYLYRATDGRWCVRSTPRFTDNGGYIKSAGTTAGYPHHVTRWEAVVGDGGRVWQYVEDPGISCVPCSTSASPTSAREQHRVRSLAGSSPNWAPTGALLSAPSTPSMQAVPTPGPETTPAAEARPLVLEERGRRTELLLSESKRRTDASLKMSRCLRAMLASVGTAGAGQHQLAGSWPRAARSPDHPSGQSPEPAGRLRAGQSDQPQLSPAPAAPRTAADRQLSSAAPAPTRVHVDEEVVGDVAAPGALATTERHVLGVLRAAFERADVQEDGRVRSAELLAALRSDSAAWLGLAGSGEEPAARTAERLVESASDGSFSWAELRDVVALDGSLAPSDVGAATESVRMAAAVHAKQQELEAAGRQLEELAAENAALERRLGAAEQQQPRSEAHDTDLAAAEQRAAVLQQQLCAAEDRCGGLQQMVEAAEESRLAAEEDRAEGERRQRADAEELRRGAAELRRELSEAGDVRERLLQDLDAASARERGLEDEVAALRAHADDAAREAAELRERLRLAEEAAEGAKSVSARLTEELDFTVSSSRAMNQGMASVQAQLEEANATVRSLLLELGGKGDQFVALHRDLAAAKKEVEIRVQTIDSLKEEAAAMRAEAEASNRDKLMLEMRMDEAARRSEEHVAALHARLRVCAGRMESGGRTGIVSEEEAAIRRLHERNDDRLRASLARRAGAVSDAAAEGADAVRDDWADGFSRMADSRHASLEALLRAQLRESEAAGRALADQLAVSEQERERTEGRVVEWQQQVDQLSEEAAALSLRLRALQLEGECKEREAARRALEAADAEAELREQLREAAEGESDRARAAAADHAAEVGRLRAEAAAAEDVFASDLRSAQDLLANALRQLQDEKAKTARAQASATERAADAAARELELRTELSGRAADAEGAAAAVTELRQRADDSAKERSRLHRELEAQSAEASSARAEAAQIGTELLRATECVRRAEDRAAAAAAELDSLRTKLPAALAERDTYAKQCAAKDGEHADLVARLREERTQLARARAEAERLQLLARSAAEDTLGASAAADELREELQSSRRELGRLAEELREERAGSADREEGSVRRVAEAAAMHSVVAAELAESRAESLERERQLLASLEDSRRDAAELRSEVADLSRRSAAAVSDRIAWAVREESLSRRVIAADAHARISEALHSAQACGDAFTRERLEVTTRSQEEAVDALRDSLLDARGALSGREQEAAAETLALRERLAGAEQRLSDSCAAASALRMECESIRRALSQTAAERDASQSQLAALRDDELPAAVARADVAEGKLQGLWTKAKAKIASLRDDLAAEQRSGAELRAGLAAAEAVAADGATRVAAAERQLQELSELCARSAVEARRDASSVGMHAMLSRWASGAAAAAVGRQAADAARAAAAECQLRERFRRAEIESECDAAVADVRVRHADCRSAWAAETAVAAAEESTRAEQSRDDLLSQLSHARRRESSLAHQEAAAAVSLRETRAECRVLEGRLRDAEDALLEQRAWASEELRRAVDTERSEAAGECNRLRRELSDAWERGAEVAREAEAAAAAHEALADQLRSPRVGELKCGVGEAAAVAGLPQPAAFAALCSADAQLFEVLTAARRQVLLADHRSVVAAAVAEAGGTGRPFRQGDAQDKESLKRQLSIARRECVAAAERSRALSSELDLVKSQRDDGGGSPTAVDDRLLAECELLQRMLVDAVTVAVGHRAAPGLLTELRRCGRRLSEHIEAADVDARPTPPAVSLSLSSASTPCNSHSTQVLRVQLDGSVGRAQSRDDVCSTGSAPQPSPARVRSRRRRPPVSDMAASTTRDAFPRCGSFQLEVGSLASADEPGPAASPGATGRRELASPLSVDWSAEPSAEPGSPSSTLSPLASSRRRRGHRRAASQRDMASAAPAAAAGST